MSIASNFRSKMDAALNSADASKGMGADARRTQLMQDLDKAGLMLIEKDMVAALMTKPHPKIIAGGD